MSEWRVALTEEQLRLIESTPGLLEHIEAECNRALIADLQKRVEEFAREFVNGTGTGTPKGIL
jgi:hypothetical protein